MPITIHFVLKDKKSDQPTPIFARFKTKGKRFVWSLGRERMIHPELWDDKRRQPIQTKNTDSSRERNQVKYILKKYESHNPDLKTDLQNIINRIENVKNTIKGYIGQQEKIGENLDYSELKEILNEKYTPHKRDYQNTEKDDQKQFITPYYESFVDDISTGRINIDSGPNKGLRYAKDTVRTYRNTLGHWKKFEGARKLQWDDVNKDLYKELEQYCNDNGNTPNYRGKIIKNLKMIVRKAHDDELHTNVEFMRKYFSAPKIEVDTIALTDQDLDKLAKCNLESYPGSYVLYRDLFLIMARTGLRFSDAKRLKPAYIKGDYITLKTSKSKNSKEVFIPIHPQVQAILKKYNYVIPSVIQPKFNKGIKEIAFQAGITEPQAITVYEGNTSYEKILPKWKLISSHTGRRTFATIAHNNGDDLMAIKKITGHSSVKQLELYLKIDGEKNAREMSKSKTFGGQSKRVK